MREPHDFARARKAIVTEIGEEAVQRLHQRNRFYDGVSIVILWAVFFGFVYLLGTLPLGWLWAVCLLLQGFVLMSFGYMMHEHFVHRNVGGRKFSRAMGLFMGLFTLSIRSAYADTHHDHHNFTGTDPDEDYKQDLDTSWKRLFYCTAIGQAMTLEGMLHVDHPKRYGVPWPAFQQIPRVRRRVLWEKRFRWPFWALVALCAVFRPDFVLLGYLLPLAVSLPLANGLRLVLEHAETNPQNDYHCATYYRTGPISRLLFFWDAGDCHLVHHLFPDIPFYRMGAACKQFRPFLLRNGVRERRSLLKLCYGFFIRNEPHRALWSR